MIGISKSTAPKLKEIIRKYHVQGMTGGSLTGGIGNEILWVKVGTLISSGPYYNGYPGTYDGTTFTAIDGAVVFLTANLTVQENDVVPAICIGEHTISTSTRAVYRALQQTVIQAAVIKITNINQTGGYYIGKRVVWNPTTEVWDEHETVYVKDPTDNYYTDNFLIDDLVVCVSTGKYKGGTTNMVYMPENTLPIVKYDTNTWVAKKIKFDHDNRGLGLTFDTATGEVTVTTVDASGSTRGLVNADTQSFTGVKTFSSGIKALNAYLGPSDGVLLKTGEFDAYALEVQADQVVFKEDAGGGTFTNPNIVIYYDGSAQTGETSYPPDGPRFVSGLYVGGAFTSSFADGLQQTFLLMGS